MLIDPALPAVIVVGGVVECVVVVGLLDLASNYCDYVYQEEGGQCRHRADGRELLYRESVRVFTEVYGDEDGEEDLGEQAGAFDPARGLQIGQEILE